MKLILSLFFSFSLSFFVFAQEPDSQVTLKQVHANEAIQLKLKEKQAIENKNAPKKNIQAQSKSESAVKKKPNKEAIQAKIDYLKSLACCEEEIKSLRQQLSQ